MSAAIASIALMLAVLSAGVRLDAQPAEAEEKPVAVDKESSEGLTYTGTVLDRVTGKPITGATVTVEWRNQNSIDQYHLQKKELKTDLEGKFTFKLTPEQLAMPGLLVITNAQHPNYASSGNWFSYQKHIQEDLSLGKQATWGPHKLWPGEAITGKVVDPDNAPLKNVRIRGRLQPVIAAQDSRADWINNGIWLEAKTDAHGSFRVVVPKDWDGVLWIQPAEYCHKAIRIRDYRGDLGVLATQKGIGLSGKLLDADGRAVPNIMVEARLASDGPHVEELFQNMVASSIGREAITDKNGEFELISLPEGEYVVRLSDPREDGYNTVPLTHAFPTYNRVTIQAGTAPAPLIIQALKYVTISGVLLDSAGNPCSSNYPCRANGHIGDQHFNTESNEPKENGQFQCRVPQGIEDLQLDFILMRDKANRWRWGPDQPLNRGLEVKLGQVDEDVAGLEIIQYEAPFVFVKVTDKEGQAISDFTIKSEYTRPETKQEKLPEYVEYGNVAFEHQQDGRRKSEGMLNDEPLRITIEKQGYTTEPQEVSLPEGAEKELVFVLKKAK